MSRIWLKGGPAAASALIVVLFAPFASATPLDGEVLWTGDAEISGTLVAGARAPAYMVHSASPHREPGYSWSFAADQLTAIEHVREEKAISAQDAVRVAASDDSGWTKTTHRFDGVQATLRLMPTQRWGSSAIVESKETQAEWVLPDSAGAWEVRTTRPINALMTVPQSSQAAGESYERRVEDRLLRVDAVAPWEAAGGLEAVFFGWELVVRKADGSEARFTAGSSSTYDARTGLADGTRLEYLELAATGAEASAAGDDGWTFYTPALHFEGVGVFPGGHYWGLAEDLLRHGPDDLTIEGSMWLLAQPDTEAVRAWGESDLEAQGVAAAPIERGTSALAVSGIAALLFLATQALQTMARLGASLCVGLYARLRDEGGDRENETRSRILDLVQREPGKNLSQIVRELDIGWGTAAYHTQLLLRQKRVKHVRVLNRVCFFTNSRGAQDDQVQTVLLNQPNYRLVMELLRGTPGLSQREVALQTGHARQYVSRLVAKLESVGLLTAVPGPSGRRYFPRGPQSNPPTPSSAVPPAAMLQSAAAPV